LKVAGLLGGGLVLVVGACGLWFHLVERRKWAALEARVAQLSAESLPANPQRRPLVGEPVPGNAWTDYQQALDGLGTSTQSGRLYQLSLRLDEDARKGAESLKGEALATLQEFSTSIDGLRRGARRATAEGPVPALDLDTVYALASLVRNRALAILVTKPDEAKDTLLDLLQFGLDLDSAGDGYGRSVCLKAVDGLHDLLGAIPRDRRPEVGRALERAEGALSLARVCRKGVKELGKDLLQNPVENTFVKCFRVEWLESAKKDWKYGFSIRHVVVDAFGWLDRWISQIATWEDLPYAEAKSRAEEQEKESRSCPNRIAAAFALLGWSEARLGNRDLIARMRLLRTACGARGLKDPYGDLLKSARDGEVDRFWSVGADGIDQGGKGGWYGRENPDIVLEVPR
jgi:hypothetical protein